MRAIQCILAPSFSRPQESSSTYIQSQAFFSQEFLLLLYQSLLLPFSFLVFVLSSSVLVLVYLCSYLNHLHSSLFKKKNRAKLIIKKTINIPHYLMMSNMNPNLLAREFSMHKVMSQILISGQRFVCYFDFRRELISFHVIKFFMLMI